MRVRGFFAWSHLWVGLLVDQEKRHLYLLPLPCVGLVLSWPDSEGEYWSEWDDPCPGCTMMICGACGRPR